MKSVVFAVAVLLSGAASAASFDCDKAGTFVEKEICTNLVLSRLDDAMAENYALMMVSDVGDDTLAEQKAEQVAWLARRDACTDYACIEQAYRPRIDALCEVPVLSGPHPPCTLSESVESW
jgi:uncharacterized protein